MAQPIIRNFVADLMELVDLPDPVVEFGSMQVEAHQEGDLRSLFPGRDFLGTDFREGPGVDQVEDLRALSFADGTVGTALCLDTLEHVEDPPQACRELARVTAGGGIAVISSVMLFGIHGYPNDYFRFTPEGFRAMLSGFDDAWVIGVGDPRIPTQVIGVGAKGRRLDFGLEDFPSLAALQRRFESAPGEVQLGGVNYPARLIARELVKAAPRLLRQKLSRSR